VWSGSSAREPESGETVKGLRQRKPGAKQTRKKTNNGGSVEVISRENKKKASGTREYERLTTKQGIKKKRFPGSG